MKNRYIIFGFICIAVLLFCFIDIISSLVRLYRFRKFKDSERYQYSFRSIIYDSLILLGFFLGFAFYHCGVSLAII